MQRLKAGKAELCSLLPSAMGFCLLQGFLLCHETAWRGGQGEEGVASAFLTTLSPSLAHAQCLFVTVRSPLGAQHELLWRSLPGSSLPGCQGEGCAPPPQRCVGVHLEQAGSGVHCSQRAWGLGLGVALSFYRSSHLGAKWRCREKHERQ